ncbi:hypothetical protein ACFFOU_15765 [Pseudonocardia sulfidoxydans]|nr:hypothetical protein [Pseudonocardia sulfidoxydans]
MVDLARVTVTNIGRTAVSISPLELDFGRRTWWRSDRTGFSGFPVPIQEGKAKNKRRRLEPGEAVDIYFDAWALIESARQHAPGKKVQVRGKCAAVSRKPTLSSRRLRWTISPETECLRPYITVTPELRAFWALWCALARKRDASISVAWFAVRQALSEGADSNKLVEVLDDCMPDDFHHFTAMQIHDAYRQ